MDLGDVSVAQTVATGVPPSLAQVEELVREAYEAHRECTAGTVADYIPMLAAADPGWFGVAVTTVEGLGVALGDAQRPFSIQSISKPFVYALAAQAIGHDAARERVGVNNTGLPFNSVMALELHQGHPRNPMVNAGAIVTTALLPGADAGQRWESLRAGLSAFAGRELAVDQDVYASETATNERNRALGRLLSSYGRLDADSEETVDLYTRQCALLVTATDLSVMGATLADGGVNPLTGERVVSAHVCRDVLAIMASAGMYENSGEWLFEIGLPAKSGVAGGIVAIAPGKGALGVFSPRLDDAGNSVRGQRVAAHLARGLGLDIFASSPYASPGASQEAARR